MTRKQLEQLPKAELIEIILQQQAALLQQQAVAGAHDGVGAGDQPPHPAAERRL